MAYKFNVFTGQFDLVNPSTGGGGGIAEYANLAAFPPTGESDIIYLALDTKKIYAWYSGAYVLISPSEVTSVNTKVGAVVLDKTDIGLGNVDNTSDANKPISTATQTALNAKQDSLGFTPENVANKSTNTSLGTSDTLYSTQNAVKSYVDTQITNNATPDATTLVKGKVKLAGDLAGTADLPTVPGLATKEPTITAGTTSQYWRGDKTFQTLDKSAVGLSNVDNTSDANKPISTATQAALDLITDVNWTGDYNNGVTYTVGDGVMFNGASFRMIIAIGAAGYNPVAYPANWLQVTDYVSPNDIGLGNVDNTSDVNKPISSATQTALNAKVETSLVGAINGVASLDGSGKVPSTQLPSYVDDVLEFADLAAFPVTGQSGIIYLALDTNKIYRWSGSAYIEISQGITDHTLLSNIGTNTHANIDTHIAGTSGVHGVTGSVVGTSDSQALTNKTIDADLNTISNIENADIKAAAAIDRTKLASGTADHVVINSAAGVMSSEAALAASRGGLGTSGAAFTGVVKAAAGVFSAATVVNTDVSATAAIDRTKLASGTANRIVVNDGTGVMADAAAITASRALVSDANGIPTASAVTSTELGYVSGVTSAIQTQIDAKQNTITGAATTITTADLTASRAVVSDASGKIDVSAATSTEVGYLSGVTSAIQTQINGKQNSLGFTPEDVANKSTTTSLGTSDTLYPTQNAVKTYVDNAVTGGATPDATTLVKGKVKLAGDLAGTADLPTVPGLATKEPTITATTSADYYRGDKTFQTLNKAAVGLSNVDNTSDADKPVSSATQTALNAKENSITAGTTGQYWRGDKSFQTLDKTAVGLSNVDNTSDADKPISSATQTALNAKENTITAGTTSQYYRGDKTFQTLDKSAVGLSNVDNTSDANKPISSATQTALNAKVETSLVGAINGVASLDGTGKVPSTQLPSYVDDVVEYANLAAFPVTGETSKIYIALDTNKCYRWSGSAYIEISPSEVNSVAGKTGIVTLVKADVGLSNVDNTSDADKPVSSATQTALNGKANTAHVHALSDLTQSSATSGQVPSWNGTNWVPVTPSTGVTDHTLLTNIGTNTHAQIDTFMANTANVYAESKEPTGFFSRTNSTLSFDNGTRNFSITPTGATFDVWVKGVRYTKTGAQTIQIPALSGNHFIYFDATGTLGTTQVSSSDLFIDNALISIIYWNTDTNTRTYFAEERHGMQMDGATHSYLHTVFGAQFISGLALQGFSVNGDGSLDAHAQFTSDSGTIKDEDITITISAQTQIPVLYRQGLLWRKKAADAFPFIYSGTAGYTGAAGRIPYNEFTGGAWQLTEIANNAFALVHLFATNDIENPVVAIQGIATYGNVTAARLAASSEITSLSGLPFAEFVALGSVVLESSNSYTNTPQAIVRSINGGDYVDFRGTQLYTPAGEPTTHGLLSGLSSDDHLQYHTDARGDIRYYTKAEVDTIIAGITTPGDLDSTAFSFANNQSVAANVTGFAFANATVRGFNALVTVEIDATADLFEQFNLQGIQKGSSWNMSIESVGDNSGVAFSITSAGQVQYTSGNVSGFSAGLIKFRAIVTSV